MTVKLNFIAITIRWVLFYTSLLIHYCKVRKGAEIMLSTSECSGSNYIYCKPFLTNHNYVENDAVFPSWKSKSIFHKEYLQYEVLRDEDVPLEISTDAVLNMNTYKCHICNMDVPKSYISEHNDGNRHKTCLKIIDIAMERTKKHMHFNIKEPRLSIRVAESYFCEPCAVIVQKNDKTSHELSKKHVNSTKYDEIIHMFLQIYEDNNIDLVNEFISEQTDKQFQDEELPNENHKFTVHNDKKESPIEHKECVLEKETKTLPPAIAKTDQDTVQPKLSTNDLKSSKPKKKRKPSKTFTENKHISLADYLKTITEKCTKIPIHSVEAVTDNLVLITALNGDKIKVPDLNFHSIHKKKANRYCKICEVPNINYNHQYSEEHMEKIMIPIEDKNALRKIDDIWSHCVLCNDMTKNTIVHLQSQQHRNQLKHYLVHSGTDINQNLLPNTTTSQLIQEHSLIINDQAIICNICNITIPNTLNIQSHVKTSEHITNYNQTIEMNELHEIDDTQFYCTPCDMCVAKPYAFGHCDGKKHSKNHTEFIDRITENECKQVMLPSISQQIKRTGKYKHRELICFVCNVTLFNIDKHMNSLEHEINYTTYLETNKLDEMIENTYYCVPCNTMILINHLMGHCTAIKHKTQLKNSMSNTLTNETIQDIENTKSTSITAQKQCLPTSESQQKYETAIPLKYTYQFRKMSNSNLLCTICDEEIPYNKHDIITHVNLADHGLIFNIMMLWNKIKILNDRYYCDVCKVDIHHFTELFHVLSSSHTDVMASSLKTTVYEYDEKLLTIEYAMSQRLGNGVMPIWLLI